MGAGNGMGGTFGAGIAEAREKSDRVIDLLGLMVNRQSDMVKAVQEQVFEEQFTWVQAQATVAGGATDVEVEVPAPYAGSAYLINQIATTGAVNGPCAVYFDQVLLGNLVHFIPNAQIHSDIGVEFYVPQNRKLIAHFYGQAAGDVCSFNFQARRLTQGF